MKRSEALELLGLTGNPSDGEITSAWRSTIRKVHPDLFPDDPDKREWASKQAARVNEAHDVLLSGHWEPESAGTGSAGSSSNGSYAGAYRDTTTVSSGAYGTYNTWDGSGAGSYYSASASAVPDTRSRKFHIAGIVLRAGIAFALCCVYAIFGNLEFLTLDFVLDFMAVGGIVWTINWLCVRSPERGIAGVIFSVILVLLSQMQFLTGIFRVVFAMVAVVATVYDIRRYVID